jgi:hypothetical protein
MADVARIAGVSQQIVSRVLSFSTTLYGPAWMLYGIEQAARQQEYFVTVAAVGTLDRRSPPETVDRLRDAWGFRRGRPPPGDQGCRESSSWRRKACTPLGAGSARRWGLAY